MKSHQDLNSRTHRDLLGVIEHALHAQNVSKIGLILSSIRLLRIRHCVVHRACSVGGTPVGREVLGFVDGSTHESAVETLL